MSLAKNIEFLSNLPKLNGFSGFSSFGAASEGKVQSPMAEVTGFGSNPGGLRMFAFTPDDLPKRAALVVVLHGCGQTAAAYDVGTGWSTLARRYGFALLMPEQQSESTTNRGNKKSGVRSTLCWRMTSRSPAPPATITFQKAISRNNVG